MKVGWSVLCTQSIAVAVSVFLTPAFAQSSRRIDRNVVYGMYSGLSLLMDVHYPLKTNGRGIIFIAGSAFYAQLGYADTPLKDTRQVHMYAKPLLEAGYTVFATIATRHAFDIRLPWRIRSGR